ncbi:MAG: DUF1624 domain-containing protein [Sandaracinaceae bacterium]|nr:DUF1624 domain-containing protein [Sandaracinaceae bacterium]
MTESKKRARVWFVDVVRLIASFQMINGHTLDALMVDELRQGALYERYTWMRGLVSVAFLTVAGLAFHLATLARFDAHRASKDEVRKRLRRAGILLLLGYFLRFPGEGLFGDGAAATESWNLFFTCGVLQCIGVALFVLEVGTILAKRPQQWCGSPRAAPSCSSGSRRGCTASPSTARGARSPATSRTRGARSSRSSPGPATCSRAACSAGSSSPRAASRRRASRSRASSGR